MQADNLYAFVRMIICVCALIALAEYAAGPDGGDGGLRLICGAAVSLSIIRMAADWI